MAWFRGNDARARLTEVEPLEAQHRFESRRIDATFVITPSPR
jgi:hypothetical protein